ncbi:MAG: hypothetical protein HDR01_10780, partial [Lachnospiraceae bacterium]|nr:hypothetical protein [Lachnospiraceae bacterium]
SIIAAIPGLGDAVGGIIKGAVFVEKCEKTVKIGKAVSTTCRMIGAIAQTGVNTINFERAFQSVREEYRKTGHVSFLNGANAVLAGLGVVGGIAQSVSSIQNFDKMVSSLSSKPSLSNGSGQQYANIADGVCFVAGTQVKTEEGRKAIEEIEAGDLVYARNTETGEEGYKEVVRVFQKETNELIHLWIGNTKIDTTPNHPFWIEGYGFREAGEMQEGDKVLTADGEVRRVSRVELEVLEEPVRVYNFEVADWHTYYVSEEEVLVHNTCMVSQGGSKTGTVWDNITPTQENYSFTNIPKSFEVEVNGQKMWVHGNATEHMYEYVHKGITTGNGTAYTNPNLYTQEIMSDFYGSLQGATKSGIVYGEDYSM